MKPIFDTKNDYGSRVVAYDHLSLDLIDRHMNWVKTKPATDTNIYLIFFLQDKEEILKWKSNKLNSNFCIVYCLEKERSLEWIKNFCKLCYTIDDPEGVRMEYCIKQRR